MSQEKNKEFRVFLREAMQLRDFTQSELASRAATTQATISRYMRGQGMPRAEELHRIATALGVTMEWLLTGDSSATGSLPSASPRPAKALRKALDEARASLDRLEKHLDT